MNEENDVSDMDDIDVTVTDIRVPYLRKVVIILEWTLASIPAALVVWVVMMLFQGWVTFLFGILRKY